MNIHLETVKSWSAEMWREAQNSSPLLRRQVLTAAVACGAPANISLPAAELLLQQNEAYPPEPRIFRLSIDRRKPARCADETEKDARIRIAALLREFALQLEEPSLTDPSGRGLAPLSAENVIN